MSQATTTTLYHKNLSLLDSFSLVGHSKAYRKMLSNAYLDGDTSSAKEKQENHSLCQHLRLFKVLFQFNLAINSFSSLDIHNLSHNITHLRSTTSLNLKLGYNNIIKTPTVLLLYHSLKYLKALQTLQVKFSSCSPLITAHIRQFCKSLQKCCSLQGLSLDFSYCESITHDFLTYLFKSLAPLYHLSSLTLIFYSCLELTSSHLQLFHKSLSRLSRLQHLRIDLDMNPPIGAEGYHALSLAIGSLASLKILDISFFGCSDFVDEPCEDLCENIGKIKNLEVLGLCFKACSFANKGLKALALCLLGLPKLKKLRMNMGSMTKPTREGYEGFIRSLGEVKNLEYLEVNLGRIREIDDGVLEVIGKSLRGLKKLRTLCLELAKCEELTDEGVERFIECFEGLEGLYDLSLDLRNCDRVTKKGVRCVYEKLKEKHGMAIEGVSYSYKWINMKNRMPEDE